MEVHFYQLQSSPLARVIYDLSQRCLQNGWRVNVVAPSSVDQVDDLLWSFDESGFFPHAKESDPRAARQDVLISSAPIKANNPKALILTGMSEVAPDALSEFERVSVLFDGRNPDELQNARHGWKTLTGAGLTAKYWSQEEGPWKMKASSDAK